jgi:hypothetical protein
MGRTKPLTKPESSIYTVRSILEETALFVASHHLSVVLPSVAKDQFYSSVYCTHNFQFKMAYL